MTTTSSEAAALEAIERLTKKAAARRAACVQMAKHRRPADLGSAVADEVAGATVPSVLLSDLEAILSGFAILPLPQVGEEAVERAAHALAAEDGGPGQPLGYFAQGTPMREAVWEDFLPEQHETWRRMARAALSTLTATDLQKMQITSPTPGAGVEITPKLVSELFSIVAGLCEGARAAERIDEYETFDVTPFIGRLKDLLSPAPPAEPVGEARTRPASEMTDAEIDAELETLGKQWDDMHADPEFEGHGGSPGEWMVERMDELETAKNRRAEPVGEE